MCLLYCYSEDEEDNLEEDIDQKEMNNSCSAARLDKLKSKLVRVRAKIEKKKDEVETCQLNLNNFLEWKKSKAEQSQNETNKSSPTKRPRASLLTQANRLSLDDSDSD